jgi:hypothetical protein
MSTRAPLTAGRRIASVIWFPFLFAIALPIVFELAFHAPQPHQIPIAVVGSTRQAEVISQELHAVSSGGFEVERIATKQVAIAAVRDRNVAAAYLEASPSSSDLYVARAASAVRATYLQVVFTQIAGQTHILPPQLVDVVPLLPGDSNAGILFFVFPMMMVGVITVLVLLQRAPTWSIERRVGAVVAMGAVGAAASYITVVSLNVLPNKPVLLLYAFFLSQIFGLILLALAPLLKQYFLPVSMTFALVLSVPSSGGTVPPDLLPTGLRYLSYVLPLAQGVKITRSVAYFDGEDLLPPTLILVAWAAIALMALGVVMHKAKSSQMTSEPTSVPSVDADSRAESLVSIGADKAAPQGG